MGKRGIRRGKHTKKVAATPAKKSTSQAKLKHNTKVRKFRAIKREVDVYVKKTTATFARAQPVTDGDFSQVAEAFKSEGEKFFKKNVKKKPRLINARITLQYKDADGKMHQRVINRARRNTNKLSFFKSRIATLIGLSEKAIRKYDVRKTITDVYVKGFTFEVKEREEKTPKKSPSTKRKKGKGR